MSNYENAGLLFDTAGELLGVRYSIFDAGSDGVDWIDAIELSFNNGVVCTVSVESEFDTLRLEVGEMNFGEECFDMDATKLMPWTDFIGGRLSWIWVLTNQQGYEDGLRIEFSLAPERPVTLIGIASSIQIFSSNRIEL